MLLSKPVENAKFTVLDLCVTRYYLYFKNNRVVLRFKYGKGETAEANIKFPIIPNW